MTLMHTQLCVRRAREADARALGALAQLDSAEPLSGERLVAERDDRVIAAISLQNGRVIADPFTRTQDAVDLLRLRYAQTRPVQRTLLRLRRRRAPRPALAGA